MIMLPFIQKLFILENLLGSFVTIVIFMLSSFFSFHSSVFDSLNKQKTPLSPVLVITFSDSLLESFREFFLYLVGNWYDMAKNI